MRRVAEFLIDPGTWGAWGFLPKDEVVFILVVIVVVVLLVCCWREKRRGGSGD